MKTIEEQLKELTQIHGPERMLQACKNLIGKQQDQIVTMQFNLHSLAMLKEVINRADEVLAGNIQDLQELVKEYKKPVINPFPEVPAKYETILDPVNILNTVDALEGSVNDIMARPDAYGNKGALLKEKARLETEIKVVEATAIMTDPTVQTLKNDTQRDAFRRNASAEQRKALAVVDGDIAALDIEIAKERDARSQLQLATESVQRKALLQAALLNFLAGGKF